MEQPTVRLRPASPQDSDFFLRLRNDPVSRANSITQDEIDPQIHRDWFARSLERDDRRMYVCELHGQPCGTVRADLAADGSYELSWVTAPEFRGKGIGTAMVRTMVATLKGKVTARTKESAAASVRIAESVGFARQRVENGVINWERECP